MPELPEVETTRRGIAPHLTGQIIDHIVVRQRKLRWPIPSGLTRRLHGREILAIRRRAKYLLLETGAGSLLLHLGMSGSLRVLADTVAAGKHDHFDLVLANHQLLRLTDPRRFGAVLWAGDEVNCHPLLLKLGPEPWDAGFTGRALFDRSRGRHQPIKSFIMDARTVVGVGNIYASEALFQAGIHPKRAAGRIGLQRYQVLASAIIEVLERAIEAGGTTLRDFVREDGSPGYFRHDLKVYGREAQPCVDCSSRIRRQIIGQRSSFYCPNCQH